MTPPIRARRPFAGEGDLPALIALLTACEAADRLGAKIARADLEEDYILDEEGWRKSVAVWEDGAGAMVAQAGMWSPDEADVGPLAYLLFDVHPDHRDDAFAGEVMDWIESTGSDLMGPGGKMNAHMRDDARWKNGRLEERGFAPERWYRKMRRPLPGPLPDPRFPAGYASRTIAEAGSVDAWVDLHNAAFVDHWEHVPLAVERRRQELAGPGYRTDLDRVAVAPDGSLAGFCWCHLVDYESGEREHWVRLIGVHPEHRRRGVARAMLLDALARLAAAGAADALLTVDSASPTGANRLYEDVGFTTESTHVAYSKRVP
ncbi:MAG: GNAT family N-acetyltransferase [Thermomicrobiales bacterium]